MRKTLIGLLGIGAVNLFTLNSEVSSIEKQTEEVHVIYNTMELEDRINELNVKLDSLIYETDSIIDITSTVVR